MYVVLIESTVMEVEEKSRKDGQITLWEKKIEQGVSQLLAVQHQCSQMNEMKTRRLCQACVWVMVMTNNSLVVDN